MADEIIKRDQNSVTVLAGVTDDASQEIRMARVDPVTGRLKVSVDGISVAATVDVGTTTTLIPGENATVTNSGTIFEAILDFGIPAGSVIYSTFGIPLNTVGVDGDWAFDTSVNGEVYYKSSGAWALVNSLIGPEGPTGPIGITWKGTYNAGTPYVVNDGVYYNGTSYICIQNGTGQTPATGGTAYWSVLALKGDPGAGSGDVIGPASANIGNFASFSDITGKVIQDSTYYPSYFATAAGWLKLDQTTPQSIINGKPTVQGFQFNTDPTVGSFSEGKIYYDKLWKTLSVDVDTDVTIQIGEETLAYCINITGSPIVVGTVVYITGASGGYPTIAPADNTDMTKSFVLGVVTKASIANNGYGHVTIRGHVNGLNTSTWTVGTSLYLGTAGALTSTAPNAGAYDVRVGRVMIQDASTGRVYVNVRPLSNLTDLGDVTIATPLTDQVLRYNGTEWVNGAPATASASIGIEFFPDDTTIVAGGGASTQSAYPIKTLSKTPITTAEDIDTITMNNSTVLYGTYLYDTALGRTTIDAGVWNFDIYAGVSSATNVTSLRQNLNRVRPGTGTVTMTGTGTTRTATASTGTPFATTAIDTGGTIDSDSFLRTPNGYFRILSRSSDVAVTIETLSTYNNESTVAYSVHKRLFQITTGEINNVATSPLFAGLQLYSITTAQPAFTVLATDKLANAFFGVSDGARSVYFSHNGTTRYSHFSTPLITLHGNLAGLQGGTGAVPNEEYYHLTSAQHTVVGNTSGTNTGDNATNTTSNSYADGKVEDSITDGHTTVAPSGNAVFDALALKLDKAGGTLTGKIVSAGRSEVGKTYTPSSGAQTVALDCAVNNMHIVSGNASGTAITFTVANATDSQPFIVSILQGGTTVSTITAWFATVRWAGGIAPTLTATLNKRDTFGFIRTGVNTYDGFIIGQNC